MGVEPTGDGETRRPPILKITQCWAILISSKLGPARDLTVLPVVKRLV